MTQKESVRKEQTADAVRLQAVSSHIRRDIFNCQSSTSTLSIFKNHRSGTVIAAGDHNLIVVCPAVHNRLPPWSAA